MAASIEDRVYVLVAEERGIARCKLSPLSTLSHDLGMEGDDAVEFFQRFAAEFKADLTQLELGWHSYFSSEAMSPVGAVIVIGSPLLLAFLVNYIIPSMPFWIAAALAFPLWLWVFYWWTRLPRNRSPQISIQDLLDCVKAGKWIKILPAEMESRRKVSGEGSR
jgi:hypothetical protein